MAEFRVQAAQCRAIPAPLTDGAMQVEAWSTKSVIASSRDQDQVTRGVDLMLETALLWPLLVLLAVGCLSVDDLI
jgi:hypothetical protein